MFYYLKGLFSTLTVIQHQTFLCARCYEGFRDEGDKSPHPLCTVIMSSSGDKKSMVEKSRTRVRRGHGNLEEGGSVSGRYNWGKCYEEGWFLGSKVIFES